MNIFGTLATSIVDNEFDYLTGAAQTGEIDYVSGWLEANIGKLEIVTNESFTGEDPDLEKDERSIFYQIYMVHYNTKKARDILRGSDNETVDWTRVQEGDTVLVRTNKIDVAREYKAAASSAKEMLDDLIAKYNIYKASPVQNCVSDDGRYYAVSDFAPPHGRR